MGVEVILPRVDMDMATGRVSRWFVPDGGPVEKGQPLFEIETDKAAMEIEAPGSGLLQRVPVSEDAIPVGSTVAWILSPNEAPVVSAQAPPSPKDDPTDAPVDAVAAIAKAAVPSAVSTDPSGGPGATPLARRLARQHDIALDTVQGSGPRARVQARDVTALAESKPMPAALPPALAPAKQTPDAPAPATAPATATAPAPARVSPVVEPRPVVAATQSDAGAVGTVHRAWLREGSGRPIVLVHGYGADLNGWRPLAAGLPAGRPVLAVDLPNHGRSAPAAVPSLDALADAVADAIAAAGVGGVDVIAHSLGSAVAVRVAQAGMIDVRSLLLLSPAGLGPDVNGAFVNGFARARGEASLAPWLRLLVHDPAVLGDGFIRAVARKRDDAAVAAQSELAATLFPDGTQAFSVRDALTRLAMPVRVVFGLEDRIIPWRHALELGPVGVHLFRGMGHMPHVEDRMAVTRVAAELSGA